MSSARHDPPRPVGLPRTEEVADGIYAYIQPDGTWWINNAGFLVGRDRITSIDSASTARRTAAYRTAIAAVSNRPITTLINTHHHGDHTNGNYQFAGATIVGHQRCREAMLAAGLPGEKQAKTWVSPEWGDLEQSPPFVTFTEGVDLWVDDLRCEIRHLGVPAHTNNDAVVWIPERSVLFAGDLVINEGTPFFLSGSLQGSISALQQLTALKPETLVPGHGPVCGPDVITDMLAYLDFVQEHAKSTYAAGLTPLEAAHECDLGAFAELSDPERIVGNLHRAYSELSGEPLGKPVNMAAALSDMVTYNGGEPLTCLA